MLRPLDQPPQAGHEGAWPLVRRLFADYALSFWRRYLVAFALMAIAAGCTAGAAYLMGEVINQAYVARNFPNIAALAGLAVALFTAKGAATYGQAVILARIGNRIIAENQRRMFAKLLSERIGFFSDRHSSEFMARLNAGAVAASQAINLIVTAVGRDFLSLAGLVAVMVIQDPVMSLFGLVVVPPAMIALRKLVRRTRTVAYSQFVGGARILETLGETIGGIRVIKAFTLEEEMQARVTRNIAEIEAASNKMARVSNRSSPLMETLGGIAVGLAILYSGYRVVETGAAPGQFFSFITAFLLAYEPGKRLARLNLDLNSALVGVRVLFDVIDDPAGEPPDVDREPLLVSKARIELRNVSFSYRPGELVLRGLSFVAEPGRVTAIVGSSGCGKSTVLSLLLRFYEVDAGAILIDGQEIAAVSRRSLREAIGFVGQDVFLFRGTIGENIAFGRLGAGEDAIVAAAKAAQAHDFITSFPLGYDTPVGEHGLQLSGGQRARIAIARALVKDAPVILLDEATASLDSQSERQVQAAIARLCENRTTIVIAHRLHTIRDADRIVVLDAGAVVESGRHEDLLRRGGRYAALYRGQAEEDAAQAGSGEPPRTALSA